MLRPPRTLLAASVVILLVACGGPPDQSTPEATVGAWFEAANRGDKEGMLSLGTDVWREREMSWERGFTFNVVNRGLRVKEYKTEPTQPVEGGARIVARAVLTLPDGTEDGEPMHFRLVKEGEVWKIAELR